MKLSNAPRWILNALPVPQADVIIEYNDNTDEYSVNNVGSANSVNIVSNNIQDVYNELMNKGVKFCFSDKVLEKYNSDIKLFDKRTVFISKGENTVALIDNSDSNILELYLSFIQNFIDETAKNYHNNKQDFIAAYNFIEQHPVFWVKMKSKKSAFFWYTENGISGLSQYFYRTDNGEIECLLETGQHYLPDCKVLTVDDDLSARAGSYEEAIIVMADNISKAYHDNGDERKK